MEKKLVKGIVNLDITPDIRLLSVSTGRKPLKFVSWFLRKNKYSKKIKAKRTGIARVITAMQVTYRVTASLGFMVLISGHTPKDGIIFCTKNQN